MGIQRGRPRSINGMWIAACVLTYDLPLAMLALNDYDGPAPLDAGSALEPHRFSAFGGRCHAPPVHQGVQEEQASAAF
ncbi:hypothetical protein [Streptomyces sp. NBC_00425]|uniref:hypothetical protein n=1 Tax=Streptomyces sp. NBC_00425 TaxID=2975740 RepID=UPI0007C6B7D1|nr:hypothetical protein [Streptomyces sp. NBC_00425]